MEKHPPRRPPTTTILSLESKRRKKHEDMTNPEPTTHDLQPTDVMPTCDPREATTAHTWKQKETAKKVKVALEQKGGED